MIQSHGAGNTARIYAVVTLKKSLNIRQIKSSKTLFLKTFKHIITIFVYGKMYNVVNFRILNLNNLTDQVLILIRGYLHEIKF